MVELLKYERKIRSPQRRTDKNVNNPLIRKCRCAAYIILYLVWSCIEREKALPSII